MKKQKFDKERTIKCSLEKVCPDAKLREIITEKALRINRIQVEGWNFINLVLRIRFEEVKATHTIPKVEAWSSKTVLPYLYCIITSQHQKNPCISF